MNGASKGTSGVVDLGTVITAHQDISGKQDKLKAGSNITISGTTISATNTTYSNKAAESGGTAVSLVTTGEKYTWNHKSSLAIGTTSTTAAAGNHTHTLKIAADSGTNQITLSASTKYKITAGGSSYIFTTPPNTNTTYSAGTGISLSGTTFSNSGVRSIASGSSNGTISVNTNGTSKNVSVKGLGSAAYTASTAYQGARTNLYNNTTGTTGTITLSQTAANFNFILIYFRNANNEGYGGLPVFAPNGKKIDLQNIESNGTLYCKLATITISGTSLSFSKNCEYYNNGSGNFSSGKYIYIVRIDGYK